MLEAPTMVKGARGEVRPAANDGGFLLYWSKLVPPSDKTFDRTNPMMFGLVMRALRMILSDIDSVIVATIFDASLFCCVTIPKKPIDSYVASP
jgi:hypothetical protein